MTTSKKSPFLGPLLTAGLAIGIAGTAYVVVHGLIGGQGACPNDTPPEYISGPTPGGGASGLSLSSTGSCSVMVDGSVWCWGWKGKATSRDGARDGAPRAVPQAGPWTSVSLAEHLRCMVRADGHAECVGTDGPAVPPLVMEETRRIVLGPSHHCALRRDRELWCWGPNLSGQLFDETANDATTPVRGARELGPVLDVAVGLGFTCVVVQDGSVRCRGQTSGGSIAPPRDLPPVVQLVAGKDHLCALSATGKVTCWGEKDHGELGHNDAGTTNEVALPGPTRELGASGRRTCARQTNGDVWCWGDSSPPELPEALRGTTLPALAMRGATGMAVSPTHGCIVTAERNVRCWGNNRQKQVSLHLPAYPGGLSFDRCVDWAEPSQSANAPVYWEEGSTRPLAQRIRPLLL